MWGQTSLQLLVILSFAPNLAYKKEIRSKAQNDKRRDPTKPQRAKFFPVVIESNDESSAYIPTNLHTRFIIRLTDKKEPKLIWIAIGRNQDQGPYRPRIKRIRRGKVHGEDLYRALGQTMSGRYLSAYFIYKPTVRKALVISARDMDKKERKSYGRR